MGEVNRGKVVGWGETDTIVGWEVNAAHPLNDGTTGLRLQIHAHDGKEAIAIFEETCKKMDWQRELTPAEMQALGQGKQVDELTVELKADTTEINEILTGMGNDIRQIETCLQVERENADKLAKMLRYLIENDETMKHEILLLGTETTLGDIVDGMLLRHDAIAAARETASE